MSWRRGTWTKNDGLEGDESLMLGSVDCGSSKFPDVEDVVSGNSSRTIEDVSEQRGGDGGLPWVCLECALAL